MAAQPGGLGAAVNPRMLEGEREARPRRVWGENERSRLDIMRAILEAHDLAGRRRTAKWRAMWRAVVAGLRGLRGRR